jgi:hypothetical protein
VGSLSRVFSRRSARFSGGLPAGYDSRLLSGLLGRASSCALEFVKAIMLAIAFLCWAANQRWPGLRRATLLNDIAIALFVLDVFLVMIGWPAASSDESLAKTHVEQGLGLYVARKIVHAHGGSLELDTGMTTDGTELDYLRSFVKTLRQKIEEDPAKPKYIVTEPWVGYRFCDPLDASGRLAGNSLAHQRTHAS